MQFSTNFPDRKALFSSRQHIEETATEAFIPFVINFQLNIKDGQAS
jgi:hypothetical protein